MRTVDVVLFDKTGTLTQGRHQVTGVVTTAGTSDEQVLALAAAVVAIGLAWVPLRVEVDPFTAAATGSSEGDGRFTIFVCVAAVVVLVLLAWQPSVRLRTGAVCALATAF